MNEFNRQEMNRRIAKLKREEKNTENSIHPNINQYNRYGSINGTRKVANNRSFFQKMFSRPQKLYNNSTGVYRNSVKSKKNRNNAYAKVNTFSKIKHNPRHYKYLDEVRSFIRSAEKNRNNYNR